MLQASNNTVNKSTPKPPLRGGWRGFILFLLLFPTLWGGLLSVDLLAQTTGYIVKGGPDTGTFTGGVFMGLGAKIVYGITEQRALVDGKLVIIEGSWNDVIGISPNSTNFTKIAPDGRGNAGAISYTFL